MSNVAARGRYSKGQVKQTTWIGQADTSLKYADEGTSLRAVGLKGNENEMRRRGAK